MIQETIRILVTLVIGYVLGKVVETAINYNWGSPAEPSQVFDSFDSGEPR